jgi:hypothetical protein
MPPRYPERFGSVPVLPPSPSRGSNHFDILRMFASALRAFPEHRCEADFCSSASALKSVLACVDEEYTARSKLTRRFRPISQTDRALRGVITLVNATQRSYHAPEDGIRPYPRAPLPKCGTHLVNGSHVMASCSETATGYVIRGETSANAKIHRRLRPVQLSRSVTANLRRI